MDGSRVYETLWFLWVSREPYCTWGLGAIDGGLERTFNRCECYRSRSRRPSCAHESEHLMAEAHCLRYQ